MDNEGMSPTGIFISEYARVVNRKIQHYNLRWPCCSYGTRQYKKGTPGGTPVSSIEGNRTKVERMRLYCLLFNPKKSSLNTWGWDPIYRLRGDVQDITVISLQRTPRHRGCRVLMPSSGVAFGAWWTPWTESTASTPFWSTSGPCGPLTPEGVPLAEVRGSGSSRGHPCTPLDCAKGSCWALGPLLDCRGPVGRPYDRCNG